ncbi:MAG: bifunctional 4-hydroxy-2-oxoglutarate aldolase/2-dehydro-3-deoxy-phosphogluconate aldolase [Alphaproteobacteria bacterium]|nr:bifunctional 4-hydroxy-2-oxoglutarate aldolase/2-dehydro-3-deoxy-phosphogluconate aldolase [Alphaproteobacteria bacterium]
MDVAATLRRAGFVPVVTIERVEHAVPLARALVAGGFPVIEVTLRTAPALDALKAILRDVPDALAGVGTVLSPEDFARSQAAGARFAFSPGFTPALLEAAKGAAMPLIPGIATPAEAMQARAHGFKVQKFFPAEQNGGIAALKAFHGPLADLLFNPTGGITEANCKDYLAQPNVVAVGASWMTPPAEMAAGKWDVIRDRARKIRALLG